MYVSWRRSHRHLGHINTTLPALVCLCHLGAFIVQQRHSYEQHRLRTLMAFLNFFWLNPGCLKCRCLCTKCLDNFLATTYKAYVRSGWLVEYISCQCMTEECVWWCVLCVSWDSWVWHSGQKFLKPRLETRVATGSFLKHAALYNRIRKLCILVGLFINTYLPSESSKVNKKCYPNFLLHKGILGVFRHLSQFNLVYSLFLKAY
jgi:hypothetical protein